jgi:hypothetical protein
MYLLLNTQASKVLQNEVQNGGGIKYFKHSSNLRNTMVVPYLDKDHWSLYIHEEKPFTTIHVVGFHNDVAFKEFACNVRIAWALLSNLNEDDAKFPFYD